MSDVDYIFHEKYTTIPSRPNKHRYSKRDITNRKNMLNNIYSL